MVQYELAFLLMKFGYEVNTFIIKNINYVTILSDYTLRNILLTETDF